MFNSRQILAFAPWRDVRFGSKADIRAAKCHVRFTPESGHVQCNGPCLLWAKSGHSSARPCLRTTFGNGQCSPRNIGCVVKRYAYRHPHQFGKASYPHFLVNAATVQFDRFLVDAQLVGNALI
jgi:hypothetical protein